MAPERRPDELRGEYFERLRVIRRDLIDRAAHIERVAAAIAEQRSADWVPVFLRHAEVKARQWRRQADEIRDHMIDTFGVAMR